MFDFLAGISIWRVIDRIVCFLFVSLLIVGRSNKFGQKNKFNDDFTSLEVMKSIRGFAAMGVILHHISQEFAFQESGVLTPFVNAGAYFVSIFFFCSGFGLIKSLESKKDYLKGFVGKRIVKTIVLPFYVNVLVYGLFNLIVKMPLDKVQWVTNLTGVTMMNVYAWFPIVLALLYLVFFICFRFIRKRTVSFVIIFLFMVALGIGTCIEGHYAWWAGEPNWWMTEEGYMNAKWWMMEKVFWFHGEWWVNSAPAFLTGLIFASYEQKIVAFFKKNYTRNFSILLAITVGLYALSEFGQSHFGYWTEFNMRGPEIGNKIATYFCQIPLMSILPVTVFIFMMKYHVCNGVTRFFGKYSLHTYLMNLMALSIFRFLEINTEDSPFYLGGSYNNLLAYALCVIVATVIFGVLEQKLTDYIQDLIYVRKQKVVYSTAPRFMDDDELKKIRKESQLKDKESAEEKPEKPEKTEKPAKAGAK